MLEETLSVTLNDVGERVGAGEVKESSKLCESQRGESCSKYT